MKLIMNFTINTKVIFLGSFVVLILLALMVFFSQQVRADPLPFDRALHLDGVSIAEVSTNAVFPLTGDLVSVSGLDISPRTNIYAEFVARKGPSVNLGKLGLKLNNTVVIPPGNMFAQPGVDDGFYTVNVGPVLVNYGGMCRMNGASVGILILRHLQCDPAARRPTETITDFTIIGSVNNSALTVFAAELRVYTLQESP